MIHKNINNRRVMAFRKGRRKLFIAKHIRRWENLDDSDVLRLSKAKIHCSCAFCQAKTKRSFGVKNKSVHSWKPSDQRKLYAWNAAVAENLNS